MKKDNNLKQTNSNVCATCGGDLKNFYFNHPGWAADEYVVTKCSRNPAHDIKANEHTLLEDAYIHAVDFSAKGGQQAYRAAIKTFAWTLASVSSDVLGEFIYRHEKFLRR